MGRKVWFPVVSGPLAPYSTGLVSWLASRAYSPSAAAQRLYQFDQLSRWLEREGLGVDELTVEQAERFAADQRAAGLVTWVSPGSVVLPLGYLRELGVAAVKRLLASCDRRRTVGRRDHAILLLLSRLGLRAGEVAAITLDDIDWRAGLLLVRGKGSRQDVLPLPVDVGEAIVAYLRRRPRCESRALFVAVNAPRTALAQATVRWIVRAACDRAGLPRVGAHRLRHTAATEMLRHGASLAEIGQVLRHREQKTTAIYAKVDRRALRALARPWPSGEGAAA